MTCSLLSSALSQNSKGQGSETWGGNYSSVDSEYFWAERRVPEREAEVFVAQSTYTLSSNPSSVLTSFITLEKFLKFFVLWCLIYKNADNMIHLINFISVLDELLSAAAAAAS